MDKLWGRLEAWAKKNAKRSLRLKKGASEKQIAAAEKKMKLNFPAAFRASLLLHDGQDAKDDTFEWMPGCSPLASLDAIVEQWVDEQEQVDPDEPKKAVEGGLLWNVLWHPRRVPIAGTPYWDGDNTYLDLHPGPKGIEGQIITLVTECDFVVLGKSFSSAIETYIEALESGDWVFDPKKNNVRPKKEKPDDYPNEADEFAAYAKKKGKKAGRG